MLLIKRLTIVVVALLLLGELVTLLVNLLGWPFSDPSYRAYHLLQMLGAIFVSLLIMRETRTTIFPDHVNNAAWDRASLLVPIGLGFSFIGDVINSNLIDLSSLLDPQTLLSIPFFTVAHVLYIITYYLVAREAQKKLTRAFFLSTVLIWPLFTFGLWSLVIPGDAPGLIKYLSLFYALVVTLMMFASSWVAMTWRARGVLIALGGFLFWVSDGIIGYFLLRESSVYATQAIWLLYFSAQLLILRAPLLSMKSKAVE